LVRGIGGVPAGGFKDPAPNHRWSDAIMITVADVRAELIVTGCEFLQFRERLSLGCSIVQFQGSLESNRLWNGPFQQFFHGVDADHG
jgi:hypothetical protein